jgi:hypothetical protein
VQPWAWANSGLARDAAKRTHARRKLLAVSL